MKSLSSLLLCLLTGISVSADSLRTIPHTVEAKATIAEIKAGMPDGWNYLGMLKPKNATEINYSLLGVGGETLDRDFADFHSYKKYLEPLGAKRLRLQSGWAKTEKERGIFDFAWLEAIIDGAIEHGLDPWLELSYGNLIYPGAGGSGLGEGLPKSEEGLSAWDRYVQKAIRLFADRVTYYEIWNEADINHRGKGETTRDMDLEYARLFVRTAEIIRREDPDAFIVGYALAGLQRRETVELFMEYLKEQNKLRLLDGFSFHAYPTNPDYNFDHVARLRATMDKYNPGIVLWQGETGAPSANQPQFALKQLDWTELSQAKWNTRHGLAHIGRGISFSQFQISDMHYKQKVRNFNTLNTKGLLKTKPDISVDRPKLAYYSFQNICSFFNDGITPEGPVEGIESHHQNLSAFSFFHAVNGKRVYALWDNSSRPGESYNRKRIELTIPEFRISNPVYIDLVSGAVYTIPEGQVSYYGTTANLKNIPLWDAPIVITDRSLVTIISN